MGVGGGGGGYGGKCSLQGVGNGWGGGVGGRSWGVMEENAVQTSIKIYKGAINF